MVQHGQRGAARALDEEAGRLVGAGRIAVAALFAAPEAPEALAAVRHLAAEMVDLLARGRHAFRAVLARADDDYHPASHALQAGAIAVAIGRQMGMSAAFQRKIGEGALVHDLGKTLVPPEILSRPTALDPDEWQVMKQHPQLGVDLLAAHGPLDEVVRWAVVGHHERLDGRGYPFGLGGDEVPLPARLVALADIYDALTTNRPYKRGLRSFEALDTIKEHMLGGLDRHLFRELVVLLARRDDEW